MTGFLLELDSVVGTVVAVLGQRSTGELETVSIGNDNTGASHILPNSVGRVRHAPNTSIPNRDFIGISL